MIKFANKTNCSPYSYILLLGSNALGNLVVHKPDSIEKSKRTSESIVKSIRRTTEKIVRGSRTRV